MPCCGTFTPCPVSVTLDEADAHPNLGEPMLSLRPPAERNDDVATRGEGLSRHEPS